MRNVLILFMAVMLLSCEKAEQPIPPHIPGPAQISQVSIGNYYPDQVWYDLENNIEVSRNKRTIWDLKFATDPAEWHVKLNSSVTQFAALTNFDHFKEVGDTTGMNFKWDTHSGNLDSTALGDWRQTNKVYVLNRGKDELGKSLGIAYLKFDSVTSTQYFFRWALPNSDDWISAQVKKDTAYNFTYFSFNNGGQTVAVEPPKNTWDLCFTQYTFAFYDMDPVVPYLVTGTLLNPNHAFSAKYVSADFDALQLSDVPASRYNTHLDNIGYLWKWYDFDQGYYITDPTQNFVLQVYSGKMFKLHFLDWYAETGEKGTASFEFSEL